LTTEHNKKHDPMVQGQESFWEVPRDEYGKLAGKRQRSINGPTYFVREQESEGEGTVGDGAGEWERYVEMGRGKSSNFVSLGGGCGRIDQRDLIERGRAGGAGP